MSKYIDVKVTVRNRYHLSDDANVPAIIEDLKVGKSVDEALEAQDLFNSPEFAYEPVEGTEEALELIDNDGQATIEVYDEASNEYQPLYTNELKRA